eukprot:1596985-Prymnesium_polylepis.1
MSRTECARQGAEAIGAKTRRREVYPVFRTKTHPYPLPHIFSPPTSKCYGSFPDVVQPWAH